jgi:hypothetical protein
MCFSCYFWSTNFQKAYIPIDIISTDMAFMLKKKYPAQRSATLNTVLMVEATLKKAEGVLTVAELKRRLPKQVMHQTLVGILDYLEYSGKITLHEDEVLWMFNEKSVLKKGRGLRVR